MNIKFIPIILLLFTTTVAKAIDKTDTKKSKGKSKDYISLNIGMSVPISDFGSKDYTNDKAGFANTGVNAALVYISESLGKTPFGIALKFNFSSNPFSYSDFKIPFTNGSVNGASAGNYISYSGLIGINLKIPIDEFSIDLRLMGGLLSGALPKVNFVAVNSANAIVGTEYMKPASSNVICYSGEAGMRYRFSEKAEFTGNIGFMNAKTKYNTEFVATNSGTGQTSTQSGNIDIPYITIFASVGVIFKLN